MSAQYEDPDEPGGSHPFPELDSVLRRLSDVLTDVSAELAGRHPDDQMRELFESVGDEVEFRTRLARSVLRSPGARRAELDEHFEAHGLSRGTVELAFKMRGFDQHYELYDAAGSWQDGDAPSGGGRSRLGGKGDQAEPARGWSDRLRGRKSISRALFKWANIFLGSMDVLPGAGALKELKDGVEAGIDEL